MASDTTHFARRSSLMSTTSVRTTPRRLRRGLRRAWAACGQRAPRNGVIPRTTRMQFRRSARCLHSKIELLKRVSADRICPGAQKCCAQHSPAFGRPMVGGSPWTPRRPRVDQTASERRCIEPRRSAPGTGLSAAMRRTERLRISTPAVGQTPSPDRHHNPKLARRGCDVPRRSSSWNP